MALRTTLKQRRADMRYAQIAKRHGMKGSLRLLWEARSAGISPSLGLALREQESGRFGDGNVWGHDPTIFIGGWDARNKKMWGPRVTKKGYKAYKKQRGSRGQGGMQGVGPLQLTWWEYQNRADLYGGCWKPKCNYRVGFRLLASLVKHHGERKGLAIYNGGLAHPNYEYASSVLDKKDKWHRLLT